MNISSLAEEQRKARDFRAQYTQQLACSQYVVRSVKRVAVATKKTEGSALHQKLKEKEAALRYAFLVAKPRFLENEYIYTGQPQF